MVEGDLAAVEAYKSSGGDIARQLTADEVRLLNRPSAFDDGFTLVHLAIRFQRQDMLAILLTEVRRNRRGVGGGGCVLLATGMNFSSRQMMQNNTIVEERNYAFTSATSLVAGLAEMFAHRPRCEDCLAFV